MKELVLVGDLDLPYSIPKDRIFFDESGSISRNLETTWSLELLRDRESENIFVRLWISIDGGDVEDMFHMDLDSHPLTPGLLATLLENKTIRVSELMGWDKGDLDSKRLEMAARILMTGIKIHVGFVSGVEATFANNDSFEMRVGAEALVWEGEATTTLGKLRPYLRVHPQGIL